MQRRNGCPVVAVFGVVVVLDHQFAVPGEQFAASPRAGLLTGVARVAAAVIGIPLTGAVPGVAVWCGVGLIACGLAVGLGVNAERGLVAHIRAKTRTEVDVRGEYPKSRV